VARIVGYCLFVFLLVTPTIVFGRGIAHSANFIVFAPDDQIAEQVLEKAEYYRANLAQEWFGEEFPEGEGRTLISISYLNKPRRALFWPIDSPTRKLHKIEITNYGTEELETLLAHEIQHLLHEMRFKGCFPKFFDEGLATRQDRVEVHKRFAIEMRRLAHSSNRDLITSLLDIEEMDRYDVATYAITNSFTSFLLEKGGKQRLFQFAVAGSQHDWSSAAIDVYSCELSELEGDWRRWLAAKHPADARVATDGDDPQIITLEESTSLNVKGGNARTPNATNVNSAHPVAYYIVK